MSPNAVKETRKMIIIDQDQILIDIIPDITIISEAIQKITQKIKMEHLGKTALRFFNPINHKTFKTIQ